MKAVYLDKINEEPTSINLSKNDEVNISLLDKGFRIVSKFSIGNIELYSISGEKILELRSNNCVEEVFVVPGVYVLKIVNTEKKVKEAFSLENVMVFGNPDTKISKLAIVPGSGRSMISEAKNTGADVFLTGDIGHHEGLDAVDMGMCVIDAGHYGLEQVFIDDMKDLIRTHFSDMNVITYKAGSPYKVV